MSCSTSDTSPLDLCIMTLQVGLAINVFAALHLLNALFYVLHSHKYPWYHTSTKKNFSLKFQLSQGRMKKYLISNSSDSFTSSCNYESTKNLRKSEGLYLQ
jgi:hypothetical protein